MADVEQESEEMITPEDIGVVLLMVLLWAFVAFTWVVTYTSCRDISKWGDAEVYALTVILGLVSVTITILVGLLTLCAIGIGE